MAITMFSWQGLTRLILAAFLVVFGIVVFLAIRERQETGPDRAGLAADPDALVESTGAIVTQAKGAKQDYRVEAERQLTYASGATKLETVRVTVMERAGRDFEVTGREASIGDDRSQIDMTGDVRLAVSDGLTATTDRALYDDNEGLLRAPGPVDFTRGRMSGSGLGATYDRNRDVLWLLDRAQLHFAPDASGGGATDIEAGTAGLARRDRYLRFEGGVKIIRPDRIIEAATAMAYLGETEDRIELLELRGGSRISATPGAAGPLRDMDADGINLSYGDDGLELRRATLAGTARVRLVSAAAQPDRHLSAEWIDAGLAADGVTLTTLAAREHVRLELPGDAEVPARVIRSEALDSEGTPAAGLNVARFGGTVEFQETAAPQGDDPGFERVAHANTLELALGGGFDDITEARFAGQTTFENGRLRAEAQAALYRLAEGVLELSPIEPIPRPVVTDAGTKIEATQIELTLEGSTMQAVGDVRTIQAPATDAPDREVPTKVPGMLKPDETVYVIGQRLDYDSETGHALYTGEARLWQGQTAVQGDSIELDAQLGDLEATGSARSNLMFEELDEETQTTEEVASISRADTMEYEDALRRITYETQAHVTGPQDDLSADKVEMYLGSTSSVLERAEAYDEVTLKTPLRDAKGERLTYFTADERYIMHGTPVTIIENCRETTGQTLTFYKSTDTISVDGNEEIRTESKAGVNCPEPPSG